MRLTTLALPFAFLSLVVAHGGSHGNNLNHPRDVDELSTRDTLQEISTRELLHELSERLERRGDTKPKKPTTKPDEFVPYICAYCDSEIKTAQLDKTRCAITRDWKHGRQRVRGWH
ncbi:hypothetical protein DFP72DRAFT_1078104 [Ephemerocybe angulata]|uniref:Uncharacterized protein n=1 Tax=Ephemerocybe angulata TaxID=980116 RepID=A0A8H6HCY9_9AGAR|nr:hypothetical protein DFP72DRAFT_1078104 [Tulosesus angulatus]